MAPIAAKGTMDYVVHILDTDKESSCLMSLCYVTCVLDIWYRYANLGYYAICIIFLTFTTSPSELVTLHTHSGPRQSGLWGEKIFM